MAASASAPASSLAAQDRKQQPSLPPPQTFDILPPMHELLSRLEHTSSTTTTSSIGPSAADALAVGGGSSASDSDAATSAALAAAETGASYADLAPLDPKDVPAEVTVAVKGRIRRALRELEKLPDMQRGVAEQEMEIGELEERVRRQREVLRELGAEVRGVLAEGGG